MAKKNYYKILGVSRTSSPEEISAAKNRLAKKYHPDANMKNGIDTTRKMQQILEAYRILSDPKKRASYDRKVFGKPSAGADRNFDLFNLHNMEETAPVTGTPFVNYWRAADSLYDITLERELEAGEYPLTVQYKTYSMDEEYTPRNGAEVNCTLIAQ